MPVLFLRMRNFYYAIMLLSSLMIYTGCTKPAGSYNFTFVNETDTLVDIFIYRTEADYNEGPYPIIKGSIQPHSNYVVPSDLLSVSHDLYADWYTVDFNYSNWADSMAQVKFTPSESNNSFHITTAAKNNYRKLCLSGNLHQSIWLAADIFDDTNRTASVWSQIPDSEKYCKLLLTRRFNGTFDLVAGNKKSIHETINRFSLTQDASGIQVHFNDAYNQIFTSSSLGNTATPNNIDTGWIHANGRNYLMIKQ